MTEALVCSKCGVLCPTLDKFRLGYMAARHNERFTSSKHKLSIKAVDGESKIADQFGWLLSQIAKIEVYGEKE